VVDCLFCKIVAGEVPAQRVAETARTLAFRDINPQAPTHVLGHTEGPLPRPAALAAADDGLLDEVAGLAHKVAEAKG
jgi:histidine triad (HIT) family protein